MGNFEKLSVLVIVVIIVMILVVALYTWTGDPSGTEGAAVAKVENPVGQGPGPGGGGVVINTRPDRPFVDGGSGMASVGLSAADILKQQIEDAKKRAVTNGPAMEDPVPTPPVPEVPVVKEPRFHVVQPGETIAKIAKIEYPGVGQRAIDAILKANSTVDPSRMSVNTKLLMPDLADVKVAVVNGTDGGRKQPPSESIAASIKPGSTYITKKGDSLKDLSKRAYRDGNQWHRIWVENFDAINDTDHLQPGTRLKIPVL
jgi:nucleoid-associated protein YgaU